MATLYEIDERIKNCFTVGDNVIDGVTGELLDSDALDQIQMERNEKIENIGLYIKNLLSDADQYQKEAENQAMRAQSAKKRAERLKQYLSFHLNGEKFSSQKLEITYKKSKSVYVECPAEQLPTSYVVVKTSCTPDKRAIKKAIEDGIEIKGCELIEKNNIQIR